MSASEAFILFWAGCLQIFRLRGRKAYKNKFSAWLYGCVRGIRTGQSCVCYKMVAC